MNVIIINSILPTKILFPLLSILILYFLWKFIIRPFVPELKKYVIRHENKKEMLSKLRIAFPFIIINAALSMLFFLLLKAFIAYSFSTNLTEFFMLHRGVNSFEKMGMGAQDPVSTKNMFVALLYILCEFLMILINANGLRVFLSSSNIKANFSEKDFFKLGLVSTSILFFFEIAMFIQRIPLWNMLTNVSLVVAAKISLFAWFYLIEHSMQVKYNVAPYIANFKKYLYIPDWVIKLIRVPAFVFVCTLFFAVVISAAHYFGIQFVKSNTKLIVLLLFSLIVFTPIIIIYVRNVTNFASIFILESPSKLLPYLEFTTFVRKILLSLLILSLSITLFKSTQIFFAIFVIFTSCIFLLLLFTFLHRLVNAFNQASSKFLSATFKAGKFQVGACFVLFSVLVVFPKKMNWSVNNITHTVINADGNIMTLNNTVGSIPIEMFLPEKNLQNNFIYICLQNSEDRDFLKFNSYNPFEAKSNWHGISVGAFNPFNSGGSSNILAQIIKNAAFFNKKFPQDFARKFSETLAAIMLSEQVTDPEQAENYYLNIAGLGNKTSFVQASLYYFGCTPSKLNELETMFLIHGLQGVSFKTKDGKVFNIENAEQYKREIKEKLISIAKAWVDKGLLDNRQLQKLSAEDLNFTIKEYVPQTPIPVKEFLAHQLADTSFNKSSVVKTTLKGQTLSAIERASQQFNKIFTNEELRKNGSDLYVATIVINLENGTVEGVGSFGGNQCSTDLVDFGEGYFLASTIKPFILQEWQEQVYGMLDTLHLLDMPIKGRTNVKNFEGEGYKGLINIDEELKDSRNQGMVNIRLVTPDVFSLYRETESRFISFGIKPDNYCDSLLTHHSLRAEKFYPIGAIRHMTLKDAGKAWTALFTNYKLNTVAVYFDSSTNQYRGVYKSKVKNGYNNTDAINKALIGVINGTASSLKKYLDTKNSLYRLKTGTNSGGAKFGWTVINENDKVLVITLTTYGKVENNVLKLGTEKIPGGAGAISSGTYSCLLINELKKETE